MKSLKLLVLSALLFASVICHAQPGGAIVMPKQGDTEIYGAIGPRFHEDADNMMNLAARLDVYYTDLVVVGIRAELGLASDSAYLGGVEALRLFPTDSVSALYAGVTAGTGFVDIDNDTDIELKLSGVGGYKRYIQPGLALYGEFELGSYQGSSSETFYGFNFGFGMPF